MTLSSFVTIAGALMTGSYCVPREYSSWEFQRAADDNSETRDLDLIADSLGGFSNFRPTSDVADERQLVQAIQETQKLQKSKAIGPQDIRASKAAPGIYDTQILNSKRAETYENNNEIQYRRNNLSKRSSINVFKRLIRGRCRVRFYRRIGFPISTCVTPTWQRRKVERVINRTTPPTPNQSEARHSLSRWAPGSMLYMIGGTIDR